MSDLSATNVLKKNRALEAVSSREKSFSVNGNKRGKAFIENVMEIIFKVCALTAIVAVAAITLYMIISGTPAIFKVGLTDILFNSVWKPTAAEPSFGIAYIVLTSIVGTSVAVLIGVPIGVFTAIFISEIANKKVAKIVKPAVELLAGIPSIVYGLLGLIIINPVMYQLEVAIFKDSPDHQFTGGANLISAILVLAIMILPTVINLSESAIRAVSPQLRQASLGLGATKIQTIFKVIIPAAKSGIIASIVLGIGRAIGEAMAIVLVSGNAINVPLPFNSVRFLTTGIVSEMSYSQGLHREALFTIGLVLFVFIMVINIIVSRTLKKGGAN